VRQSVFVIGHGSCLLRIDCFDTTALISLISFVIISAKEWESKQETSYILKNNVSPSCSYVVIIGKFNTIKV